MGSFWIVLSTFFISCAYVSIKAMPVSMAFYEIFLLRSIVVLSVAICLVTATKTSLKTHEPALQLQHGIFVLALGDGDVLHGSICSELAPADGNAGFHCHSEPELAARRGRAFQSDARVFGEREQEVGGVPDRWDKLIQTLIDGRSGELIDRIPTFGGGVILYGSAASVHSPDCAPLWGKIRCTSSCSMARVSLQALKPKALSRA